MKDSALARSLASVNENAGLFLFLVFAIVNGTSFE
jgi:hypothetical protein